LGKEKKNLQKQQSAEGRHTLRETDVSQKKKVAKGKGGGPIMAGKGYYGGGGGGVGKILSGGRVDNEKRRKMYNQHSY